MNTVTGREVTKMYFIRTQVQIFSREESLRYWMRNRCVLGIRWIRRFRFERSMNKQSSVLRTEGLLMGEGDECVLSLDETSVSSRTVENYVDNEYTDVGIRTVRKKGKRNEDMRSSGDKGNGRMRRRRIVNLDSFAMFGKKSSSGEGRRECANQGGMDSGDSVVLTEREKFSISTEECILCSKMLSRSWKDLPFF